MKYIESFFLAIASFCFITTSAYGWDGTDSETGGNITIESGNLVRPGNDIEIYDSETGKYKDVEVESVSSTEVEVYDREKEEYRSFDME